MTIGLQIKLAGVEAVAKQLLGHLANKGDISGAGSAP